MALPDKLVLVPLWVEELFKSYNIPLHQLTNLKTLAGILMKEDLARLIQLHTLMPASFFKHVFDTFTVVDLLGDALRSPNYQADKEKGEPYAVAVDHACLLMSMDMSDPRTQQSLVMRLMAGSRELRDDTPMAVNQYVFNVTSLKEGLYGIRLVKIDPLRTYLDQYHEELDKLLALLQHAYSFEQVAQVPVFGEYLRVGCGMASA